MNLPRFMQMMHEMPTSKLDTMCDTINFPPWEILVCSVTWINVEFQFSKTNIKSIYFSNYVIFIWLWWHPSYNMRRDGFSHDP